MGREKIKRQRTCVGCRIKKLKEQMIRLVLNQKGELIIDKNQNLLGRGVYLCKSENSENKVNEECLKLALKRRSFNYGFRNQAKKIRIEKLFDYPTTDSGGIRSCRSWQN